MSHGTEAQFPPPGRISFQVRRSQKLGCEEKAGDRKGPWASSQRQCFGLLCEMSEEWHAALQPLPCYPRPPHTDAHPRLACEAACLERGLKPKPQNPTFLLRAVCVHTLALWPPFLSEQGFSRLWVRSPGLRCSSALSQPRDFSMYPLGGSVSLSVKWS